MNFPIAMLVLLIGFVGGALAFYKVMEFFGFRKFTEENEKPKIKPR